ncbi:hypothetical protein BH23CHL5_BH23CHL5_21190 [soil metagenome]
MTSTIVSYSRADWARTFFLLVGEIAVVWVVVNVILVPLSRDYQGMQIFPFALLYGVANVLPRVLHDRWIWGSSYSLVLTFALVASTATAIWLTAFPNVDLTDSFWLTETFNALALKPHAATLPVWPIVALSSFCWWRGGSRDQPSVDSALSQLQVGSGLLLISLIVHATLDPGLSQRQTSGAVLAFFGFTLVSIAEMRQDFPARARISRWLETVGGPVIAIAIPALIVVGLLSRDLAAMIELIADPILWVLTWIGRILAFILIVLALIVLYPLLWLVSRLPFSTAGTNEEGSTLEAGPVIEQAADRVLELPDAARYLLVILALILLYAGIVRFRLRLNAEHSRGGVDEDSAVISGSIWSDIRNWLGGLARREGQIPIDPLGDLRRDQRWRHTVVVRERYADFLTWSQFHGLSRTAATTPDELAARWSVAGTPVQIQAVQNLTATYDRVRYMTEPASEADAIAMTAAWETLRSGSWTE